MLLTDIITWEEKYYSNSTYATNLSSTTYIFTTSPADYYSRQKVSPIVISVQADGHCGYRALSYLLYQNENYWQRVRTEMANFFKKMICTDCAFLIWDADSKNPNFVDKTVKRIECADADESRRKVARRIYWFFIPDCLIIASYCYQRIIMLTSQVSSSYAGVSIPPKVTDKPLCMHWQSENHFSACKTLPTVLPTVFPSSLHWIKSHDREKTMQILFETYMEKISNSKLFI